MISKKRGFWFFGAVVSFIFMVLFLVRLEFFKYLSKEVSNPAGHGAVEVLPFETWMTIVQNKNRIGFSHRLLERTDSGYHVVEETIMKVNTMGMVHDVAVTTESETGTDFSLGSFDFKLVSGRFSFHMTGSIRDSILWVTTGANKEDQTGPVSIELAGRPYLASGIVQGMGSSLDVSDEVVVFMFDPITMGQVQVKVRVLASESLKVMGENIAVKKLSLKFKGVTLYAWMDGTGRVVKEEGILGMTLMAASRKEALEGIRGSDDLTLLTSIQPGRVIDSPEEVTKLEVVISGIDPGGLDLDGGRQSFVKNSLTITREKLLPIVENLNGAKDVDATFLAPGPFIESNHPRIVNLVDKMAKPGASSLEKIRAVLAWMGKNIEKRPVLSLPDALSTLRNRMGDCNEHAVLFAAFCRAFGIPARVEAGLVYINNRFYYHAWNGVYLGRWITVDSLFNQMPADVTHIRLVSGAGARELDLVGVINRINIEIVGEVR